MRQYANLKMQIECSWTKVALRAIGYHDVFHAAHGLISTGVPSGTVRQISSISESVTAMQPAVQSTHRCNRPIQPNPFGKP